MLTLAGAISSACSDYGAAVNYVTATNDVGFKPMIANITSTGNSSGGDFADKTRASSIDISALQNTGFSVYAYKTLGAVEWADDSETAGLTPNFMVGKKVSFETSSYSWKYYPVEYWPQFELLSFFAITPIEKLCNVDVSYDTNVGKPTVIYDVPVKIEEQIDLLAGCDVNKSGSATDTDVNIQFNHTLAKIGFSARLDQEITNDDIVRVHELKIYFANDGEFRYRGAYDFISEKWTVDETLSYGGGDVELKWGGEDSNNPIYTTMCIHAGDIVAADEYLDETEPTNLRLQGAQVLSNETVTSLNDGDDYMMLMPQYYNEESMFIYIRYTTGIEATEEEKVVPIPQIRKSAGGEVIPFEEGKSYTFLLTLSTYRDIIFGGVQVDDWLGGDYYEFDFDYPNNNI